MAVVPVVVDAQDLEKGMPFTTARKLLLAQHWRPVNVHVGKDYQYIGIEKMRISVDANA